MPWRYAKEHTVGTMLEPCRQTKTYDTIQHRFYTPWWQNGSAKIDLGSLVLETIYKHYPASVVAFISVRLCVNPAEMADGQNWWGLLHCTVHYTKLWKIGQETRETREALQ